MTKAPEINFLITFLPIVSILFIIIVCVVILYQHFHKNLYQQMLAEEELKNRHQHKLLRSVIEAQEKERKRIAHDLHDEVGTLLTTSRLYFNQLDFDHDSKEIQLVSSKMNALFDEMMANIRRISHDLRPVVLENLGLMEAIDALRDKLIESGLHFHFSHIITTTLTKEAELNLYRIVQELIGNTIKHARASNIFMEMKDDGGKFQFHYRDDGVGFLPSTKKKRTWNEKY